MVRPSVLVERLFCFRIEIRTLSMPGLAGKIEQVEHDAKNKNSEYSQPAHRRRHDERGEEKRIILSSIKMQWWRQNAK